MMSPTLMPALIARAFGRDARHDEAPLHLVGRRRRARAARRPAAAGLDESARIGFNASIGTNMLPGTHGLADGDASRTISEPTPTSFMSWLDQRRAAPVQRRAAK